MHNDQLYVLDDPRFSPRPSRLGAPRVLGPIAASPRDWTPRRNGGGTRRSMKGMNKALCSTGGPCPPLESPDTLAAEQGLA
jgi:hypothetical protein